MKMSVKKEPKTINGIEVWLCPGCGEWKLAEEFYKSPRNANGLSSYCKCCQKKLVRNYQKNELRKRKEEQKELERLRSRVKVAA